MNFARRITDTGRPFAPIAVVDKEVTRIRCYALLAIGDALAIAAAFIIANTLVSRSAPVPIEHGFVMLSVVLPLFGILAGMNGAYSAATLENSTLGASRSARALVISGAVVLFFAYLLKASSEFSRGVFAIGFAGSLALLIAGRKLLARRILRMLAGSAHTTVVVIDGVSYEAKEHEVVLHAGDFGFDPLTQDPRAYHALARTVAHADRMIVACTADRAASWATVLRSLAVDGEIFTTIHDEVGAIGMRQHGGRSTLLINYGPMNFSARLTKRAFDVAVSLGALVVLSPLLIATAIAIRWESPGPVFFRQERIGRDNKIFRIFKFRSMFKCSADEHGAKLTQQRDDRVTGVGRFIRRTSIDELPQLLNVLSGEMSIVGPRPHALAAKAADQLYWDVDARYRQRHVIKPGMTGLAQVRGYRGNTHRIEDLTNRLQADLEYVVGWSLRNDVVIILKTLKVMAHTNAY